MLEINDIWYLVPFFILEMWQDQWELSDSALHQHSATQLRWWLDNMYGCGEADEDFLKTILRPHIQQMSSFIYYPFHANTGL